MSRTLFFSSPCFHFCIQEVDLQLHLPWENMPSVNVSGCKSWMRCVYFAYLPFQTKLCPFRWENDIQRQESNIDGCWITRDKHYSAPFNSTRRRSSSRQCFVCSEQRVEVSFMVRPEAVGPLSSQNRVQVHSINWVYYIDTRLNKYRCNISPLSVKEMTICRIDHDHDDGGLPTCSLYILKLQRHQVAPTPVASSVTLQTWRDTTRNLRNIFNRIKRATMWSRQRAVSAKMHRLA